MLWKINTLNGTKEKIKLNFRLVIPNIDKTTIKHKLIVKLITRVSYLRFEKKTIQ